MTTTKKTCNEYEIIKSDRIELLSQANTFIETMTYKQIMPLSNGSFTSTEMTEDESRAYTAALLFIERQFRSGCTRAQVFDKVMEYEETSE